jgi:hypothetical protein
MKISVIISRIILGLVFIFSGIVKAIDPLGTAYKFQDYFQAFNIAFLKDLALPLSVLLCLAEFISGFSILSGMRLRAGIWSTFLLLVIFTPVTFILALTNPVSDCGCFGDAIHLTNWQTFGKNIILFLLWAVVFYGRNQPGKTFSLKTEWSVIMGASVLFIGFCVLNLRYLPAIDFLPYKKNVKIADKMVVPEDATADQYQTTFIYEKDGVREEFSLDNYPADDSTWKFIDQKSVLLKKGYEPPIHDFLITAMDGEDLTDNILSHKGYTLLMITKKLNEADEKNLSEGFLIGRYCQEIGINFFILTASGSDEVNNYGNDLPFCTADETTLKTMLRSNPGYMLLKDGIIIDKWSWANVPEKEWFEKKLSREPTNE